MASQNRARAWLQRLSSGKREISESLQDNSDSNRSSGECLRSSAAVNFQGMEASHGTNRARDTSTGYEHLQPQAPKQATPRASEDHVTCYAMSQHAHAAGRAAETPTGLCSRKKLHRSLSWRSMVFRRQAPTRPPRATHLPDRPVVPQESDDTLPKPKIAPVSCNSESSAALSPLRHVYSMAGTPSTPSSLARSTSHASSSSSSSSGASRATMASVCSCSSMAYSSSTVSTHRPCAYSSSRSEPHLPRNPSQHGTGLLSTPTTWSASPPGYCNTASMECQSAAAYFLMQDVRLLLTIRDADKRKLKMLFHSRFTTIGQVKEQIQKRMGNRCSQQELAYKGLVMPDDVSLGSFIRGNAAVLCLDAPFRDLPM